MSQGFALAEHDRMISAMILPCTVEAVQMTPPRVRVRAGEWVSGWLRWHSLAAGSARHWRAPSLGEQGSLVSPSGEVGAGTFIPGLFGDAGPPPDNRDHVEVWRFDDGAALVYDWQAHRYTITLPAGEVAVQVGEVGLRVTEAGVLIQVGAAQMSVSESGFELNKGLRVAGGIHATENITSDKSIVDTTGNSNHHSH